MSEDTLKEGKRKLLREENTCNTSNRRVTSIKKELLYFLQFPSRAKTNSPIEKWKRLNNSQKRMSKWLVNICKGI